MKKGSIFIFSCIFIILALLLYLFKAFLLVIIIASLMSVATANINAKFLRLTHGRKVLAAGLTTLCFILLFFTPLIYVIIELTRALQNFDLGLISHTLEYLKNYQFSLPEGIAFIEPKIKEFLNSIDLANLSRQALNYASSFTRQGAKFLIDMALICVFFFFANLYGTELIIYAKSIIPIDKAELEGVLSEVANVMSVVLYSMVIVAIFQGALFGLITVFYGYDGFLMGVIFAVSSLIPAIGGALIYVPVSLYQFASSGLGGALTILIYSVLVISFLADTIIKPLIIKWINLKLVKTPTKINELLIFLAMLAGISSFGFWGIILGPAILTFFISSIKMYVILKGKNLI